VSAFYYHYVFRPIPVAIAFGLLWLIIGAASLAGWLGRPLWVVAALLVALGCGAVYAFYERFDKPLLEVMTPSRRETLKWIDCFLAAIFSVAVTVTPFLETGPGWGNVIAMLWCFFLAIMVRQEHFDEPVWRRFVIFAFILMLLAELAILALFTYQG